jgi:hypothetical protein
VDIAKQLPKLSPRRRTVDRKTASKAVAKKVSGTYSKSVDQFEGFARDTQMPESMRALAEKSVAHTRELYEHSFEAVLESWERFVDAAGRGVVAFNSKAIEIARHNINNSFGLAQSLAGAKNVAEAMELQGAYWRKQLDALGTQAKEVRALSVKITADMAAPIKAQVAQRSPQSDLDSARKKRGGKKRTAPVVLSSLG